MWHPQVESDASFCFLLLLLYLNKGEYGEQLSVDFRKYFMLQTVIQHSSYMYVKFTYMCE